MTQLARSWPTRGSSFARINLQPLRVSSESHDGRVAQPCANLLGRSRGMVVEVAAQNLTNSTGEGRILERPGARIHHQHIYSVAVQVCELRELESRGLGNGKRLFHVTHFGARQFLAQRPGG